MRLAVACLLLLTTTSSSLMGGLVQRNWGWRRCWLEWLCLLFWWAICWRDSSSHPKHWQGTWVTASGSQPYIEGHKADSWLDKPYVERRWSVSSFLPTTTITSETLLAVSHLPKTVIGDSPKLLHDSKCVSLEKMLAVVICVMYWNRFYKSLAHSQQRKCYLPHFFMFCNL